MKKTLVKPAFGAAALALALAMPQGLAAQKPLTFEQTQKVMREKRKQRADVMPRKVQAPRKAEASASTILYGSIIDSYSETYYVGEGIYAYSPYDANSFSCVKEGIRVYGGGTYGDGIYYGQNFTENNDGTLVLPVALNLYDTNAEWALSKTYYAVWYTNIASDLTYDPTQKTLYGVFWNEEYTNVDQFGYIAFDSPSTFYFEPIIIGTMPERMVAIAAAPDGTLYGLGRSSTLYTIDKATGETNTIKRLFDYDVVAWYQSACFDEATGHIFWHTLDNMADWMTYEIDPATGNCTLVTDLGYYGTWTEDQITGLTTLKDPAVRVYAPLPAADLTASFAGNAGTASFTLPTQNAGGESLSGTLSYALYVNGKLAKTGSAAAGSKVSESISAEGEGSLRVSLTVSDGNAVSRVSATESFAGAAAPLAPPTVAVQMISNTDASASISVSWVAPSTDESGAAIDPSTLTYSVTRQPDALCVYEGSGTSFVDEIAGGAKRAIYYEVKAIRDGKESPATASDLITIGTKTAVPFTDDFTGSANDYAIWNIIDANNDGSTWTISGGTASYRYNAKNGGDDYLVLPGMELKAGQLYHFDIVAHNTSLVERLAAYVAESPDYDGENGRVELVAPTDITYEPRLHSLRGDFKPEHDGIYYFAVQCCSEPDMSTVYVDKVSVTVTPGTAPEAPANVVVTPGDKGALSATIAFDVPARSINGNALAAVDYCIVRRDGNEVARISDKAPGTHVEYTDAEGLKTGMHTYVVTAVSDGTEGDVASQSKYIGLDAPAAVRNLKAVEDLEQPGLVVLTWDAPEVGQHGGYVNPDDLVYFVSYGYSGDEVSTYERTFSQWLDISAGQTYQAYSVYAENSAGSGRQVWQTVVAIAGEPVEAPVVESFPGVTMNSGPWLPEMVNGEIGEARWTPCDGSVIASGTQDGDGGVLNFSASRLGASSRIISPKISVAHLQKPLLSFWVYLTGKKDQLKAELSADYGDYTLLKTIAMDEAEAGWHRYTFDLSAWKQNQFVRIAFQGVAVETYEDITSFDNFAIAEGLAFDLQANELRGPEKIKVGEKGSFSFALRNMGNALVKGSDYKVELLKNGKLCSSVEGLDIPVDATIELTLQDVPTIDDSEVSEYTAQIVAADDENPANNVSNATKVEIILPEYPRVTNLQGVWTGDRIRLFWEEPNFADMPAKRTTETFEAYPAFAISDFGSWKTVDADGQRTIRITLDAAFGPLEYPHAGEPMAFQVFNATEAGIPFSSWDPHSGEQMLVAFKCGSPNGGITEVNNDDWLISPELNGTAQTISFYAKTGMGEPYVPEKFQVLCSTTTTELDAFKQIGETYEMTNVKGWQEVKALLPAGAKYFAIRCVSEAKFALLIDDVTYIPAGAAAEEISLMGYNVYRDGERMNGEPLPESVWEDMTTAENETHLYRVTAVYDKGESLYSNEVSVKNTSIDRVEAAEVNVETGVGYLCVQGADGQSVAIYGMDGRCLHTGIAAARHRIAAPAGYYVVKVGKAAAVTVRVR